MTSAVANAPLRKKLGVFYTPDAVAQTLVRWVVRSARDRLLDPACGDGRFLACHRNAVGVDRDVGGVVAAIERSHPAMIHVAEFFSWACDCQERFDCAAGNPPFIRYQQFSGNERRAALRYCSRIGVDFSGLTSSWAPYLVVAASLLKPGGRMAFVIPAEVGHAPYAQPLIRYLVDSFSRVQFIAIREKLFPELSEDVWILFADGFGGRTSRIAFTARDRFESSTKPPKADQVISLDEWKAWNSRLRVFLLPEGTREVYRRLSDSDDSCRLGSVARVGIGYVTGANDFFHLRPSQSKLLRIPKQFLMPTVRNAKWLTSDSIVQETVGRWLSDDHPVLLLRLPKNESLPKAVWDYLESAPGDVARTSFKCRHRKPWYVVPDVRVPDAFLSYMSGHEPILVENAARCTCTNSVHAVSLSNGLNFSQLRQMWDHPLTELSCEIEGHPLGGGMLKIEPGEAARILLPKASLRLSAKENVSLSEGTIAMRRWRHYG